jgi:hypothetical protein
MRTTRTAKERTVNIMDRLKGLSLKGLLMRAVILLAALVAATLFINLSWFDEPLHPDLAALLPAQPVSMDDNAYPLFYGLMAADDRDPRSAGLEIIARLRDRYQRGEPVGLSDDEMSQILGSPDTTRDDAWRDGIESIGCNSRFEIDCAERMIADVGDADRTYPRLSVLLRRYEQILASPRFEENQEFDVTTPIPSYALQIPRIRLALSFNRDPLPVFLAKVEQSFDFWKLMLRDGQSLIAKMIALAAIRNDLSFLSAAMKARDFNDAELEILSRFLSPLTSAELDIGETFLAEMRIALLSQKPIYIGPAELPLLTRLFMQDRATTNESYTTVFLPLRLRASLGSEEFFRQRGYEPLRYDVRAFPPPLYNLGGKLELSRMLANGSLQDYISRAHDLNGRILLVMLQAEIEARSESRLSSTQNIERIVRSSPTRNPYTGAPMDYG